MVLLQKVNFIPQLFWFENKHVWLLNKLLARVDCNLKKKRNGMSENYQIFCSDSVLSFNCDVYWGVFSNASNIIQVRIGHGSVTMFVIIE
jgi:hypothetical protein